MKSKWRTRSSAWSSSGRFQTQLLTAPSVNPRSRRALSVGYASGKMCQWLVTMNSSPRRRKKASGIGSSPSSAIAAASISTVRRKLVSSVGSKPRRPCPSRRGGTPVAARRAARRSRRRRRTLECDGVDGLPRWVRPHHGVADVQEDGAQRPGLSGHDGLRVVAPRHARPSGTGAQAAETPIVPQDAVDLGAVADARRVAREPEQVVGIAAGQVAEAPAGVAAEAQDAARARARRRRDGTRGGRSRRRSTPATAARRAAVMGGTRPLVAEDGVGAIELGHLLGGATRARRGRGGTSGRAP